MNLAIGKVRRATIQRTVRIARFVWQRTQQIARFIGQQFSEPGNLQSSFGNGPCKLQGSPDWCSANLASCKVR
eukprot:6328175-Pyramimonas_sp.AAC.1